MLRLKIAILVLFALFQLGLLFVVTGGDTGYQIIGGLGMFMSLGTGLILPRGIFWGKSLPLMIGFTLLSAAGILLSFPTYPGGGGILPLQGIVAFILADLAGFLIGEGLNKQ